MRPSVLATAVSLSCLIVVPGLAIDRFELPPIEYSTAAPDNRIAAFQKQLDAGTAELTYDERRGYLDSLLKGLGVPVESQALVFSQTSLQRDRISPRTPRALYFNDDVYVGYCQSGDVLELSVADSRLGTVFYTLDQARAERPVFVRQTDKCLQCHESSRTEGVPGHLMRSLFVEESGQPIFSGGSHDVDHRTPFEHRWGGWYVTGTHGTQKHLGNLTIAGRDAPLTVENAAGQNLTQLPGRKTAAGYLTRHSDIVALMVLEHQILVHNRIAKANFAVREALHADGEMRRAFGEPAGPLREGTMRRIRHAGDELVEALLLKDEAKLTAAVAGTSGFSAVFVRQGRRDSKGRSLRDFDLRSRLFEYPCSYLIESTAFASLPVEVRSYVWDRLHAILVQGTDRKKFGHLTDADRQAIVDILRETQTDLPLSWKMPRPK